MTHSLLSYSTLVIHYLMSADSPYYIYYARDDEEPHFIFLDYSPTCSHLSHTYLQATFTTVTTCRISMGIT